MEIKYFKQPQEIKLGDILNVRLELGKFDNVWMMSGMTKDSGIDVLHESMKIAISKGTKINIALGLDKKNTSKDMLLRLLDMGCNLKIFINTDDNKFETRIYIFEKYNDTSYVYLTSSKLSVGGLLENSCLVTEIKYTNEDNENFKTLISKYTEGISLDGFTTATREQIIKLAEDGEIFARIIDRKIPRISDVYKNETFIGNNVYDENTGLNINKEELEDIDIDIDIDVDSIAIKKNVEILGEKLSKNEAKPVEHEKTDEVIKKSGNIITNADEANFENISTLIIEANKIALSGVTTGEIKIPNAISKNMNEFFDYPDSFEMITDKKGKTRQVSIVKLDIFDNNNVDSLVDDNVLIYETERYLAIKSDVVISLNVNEEDIIRIIKVDNKNYRFEIIRKDSNEYEIWERYLIYKIKGQKRRYGVI